MIRRELHPTGRAPDALSHAPARPHFDAVAWKRRQTEMDGVAATRVADLLARLEQAPPARNCAEAA